MTTKPGDAARPIHQAARTATRAIRQAREWTRNDQNDKSLQLAEQLLDEISLYALLRADFQVPADQAQERLVQFLDNLLGVK